MSSIEEYNDDNGITTDNNDRFPVFPGFTKKGKLRQPASGNNGYNPVGANMPSGNGNGSGPGWGGDGTVDHGLGPGWGRGNGNGKGPGFGGGGGNGNGSGPGWGGDGSVDHGLDQVGGVEMVMEKDQDLVVEEEMGMVLAQDGVVMDQLIMD